MAPLRIKSEPPEPVITISDSESCSNRNKRTINHPAKASQHRAKVKTSAKPGKSSAGQLSIESFLVSASSAAQTRPAAAPVKRLKRRQSRPPPCKTIEGTRFAVDAFQYAPIAGIRHYFLTHFHADHYVGLKRSFVHALHVSPTTGRLVREFIGVAERFVHVHAVREPFELDGWEITALDANHCPGAVMFLFRRLPADDDKAGPRCILHTGDFRASADMESYPELWNCPPIERLYLDTTYLPQRRTFLGQHDALQEIRVRVHAFLQHSVPHDEKPLLVVGTYLIGKERVWSHLADVFDLRVWLDADRERALQCVLPAGHALFDRLVRSPQLADVLVVPLQHLTHARLVDVQRNNGGRRLLAIRPSGWERAQAAKSTSSAASELRIVGVPYSEHSSFDELRRFVRFVRPGRVISTVPTTSNGADDVPADWLDVARQTRPDRPTGQLRIERFLRPQM